jgi:hypothetical protein
VGKCCPRPTNGHIKGGGWSSGDDTDLFLVKWAELENAHYSLGGWQFEIYAVHVCNANRPVGMHRIHELQAMQWQDWNRYIGPLLQITLFHFIIWSRFLMTLGNSLYPSYHILWIGHTCKPEILCPCVSRPSYRSMAGDKSHYHLLLWNPWDIIGAAVIHF